MSAMEIDDADVRVTAGPMATSVMWVNPENIFDNGIAEASRYLPGGDDHWYVNRVKVREPTSYGRGIGSYLLNALMKNLKSRGAVKVIVEPGGYGSDVGRLIPFYEKHGFVLKGEGPDDPYMSMEWVSEDFQPRDLIGARDA